MPKHTLLSEPPPLVLLELLLRSDALYGGIAPGLGKRDLHRLVKDLEALHFLDGRARRFGVLEDDKGLALRLQARFRDDVDDISILGEYLSQRILDDGDLDALFEIADVNPGNAEVILST